MRKEQLIYEAASEAVFRARRIIASLLNESDFQRVDDVLSTAQHSAGEWAVAAKQADARKIKSTAQLINSL